MPMSLPSASTSAPPELPGLIAASVWIMFVYTVVSPCCPDSLVELSMICERLVADTMPVATDCSRPKGLPIDMTHSPMVRLSESPNSIAVRPDAF